MSVKKYFNLAKKVFLINRSITGKGTYKTLKIFSNEFRNFKIKKFHCGKKVFDWRIPDEWNIDDSYIEHISTGDRYAMLKDSFLHVLVHSEPVDIILSLSDLKKKIKTLPSQPDNIPYFTSYYHSDWGFCMSKNQLDSLPDGKYRAVINSKKSKGEINVIDYLHKGRRREEILISSYLCHPQMANNEASGPVVLRAILDMIKTEYKRTRFSYRFLLGPETIGAISYIYKFARRLRKNVVCGFVLSCVGDGRSYSFVKTPSENTLADQAIRAALIGIESVNEYDFTNRGSDGRQFCGPGIELPVCTFCNSLFRNYPEYHTDADSIDLISESSLLRSAEIIMSIIRSFEFGLFYKSTLLGEPWLSKRGLYPSTRTAEDFNPSSKHYLDIIYLCNGKRSIFTISIMLNIPLSYVIDIMVVLKHEQLIQEV